MKYWIPLLTVLTSCSLIPSNTTENTALLASESIANQQQHTIKSVMEAQKPPPVSIRLGTNVIEVAPAYRHEIEVSGSGSANAGASSETSIFRKISLPIGVSMLLAAGGIFGIFAALKYARKQSAALNAGFTVMDQTLAGKIRNLRDRAVTSTDHSEISRLNSEIGSLEADRARVKLN